jgi:hypothetical protein
LGWAFRQGNLEMIDAAGNALHIARREMGPVATVTKLAILGGKADGEGAS